MNFAAVGILAGVLLAAALAPTTRVPGRGASAARGLRLWSRHAVPAAAALILVALGSSAIYASVPLYAMRHGLDAHVGWFFALYSTWLVLCRVLLRSAADRLGRARVLVASMASTALGFFRARRAAVGALARCERIAAGQRGIGAVPDAGRAGGSDPDPDRPPSTPRSV